MRLAGVNTKKRFENGKKRLGYVLPYKYISSVNTNNRV